MRDHRFHELGTAIITTVACLLFALLFSIAAVGIGDQSQTGVPPSIADGPVLGGIGAASQKYESLLGTLSVIWEDTFKTGDASVPAATGWVPIGPHPIGSASVGYGGLPYSGKVTDIAVVDSDTVYIGSATGGVWKTTNGGVNWTPLTDTQPCLAIGAVAVDPTNPDVVYAGLADQDFMSGTYCGIGILKSTDGGISWTLSRLSSGEQRIARICVDPNDPKVVYAATINDRDGAYGVATSRDAGLTWSMVHLGPGGQASDVVIDATTNPSTVYASQAGCCGVWKTTTSSDSWTWFPGSGTNTFPPANADRVRLAITRGANPTLYAVAHGPGGLLGVWKTTDGGLNWIPTANPESAPGAARSASGSFLNIAVYPTDPNILYVLTTELFKSTNGGASWTVAAKGYSSTGFRIHPDQHALDFIPGNPNSFYLGNDGGIYKSVDAGSTFSSLNNDLAITEFYRGAAHPTNINSVIGGTQDNGTLSYENSLNWQIVGGGDGCAAAIDYVNPSNVYTSADRLGFIGRSSTGPRGSYTNAMNGIAPESQERREAPCSPLVMDPNDPRVLYTATTRVYRTSDGATSWIPLSPVLSTVPPYPGNGGPNGAISAIAPSKSAPNTIYVGTGASFWPPGTESSAKVWVTTDGGTNWVERTGGLANRFITSIAVDPNVSQTAYLTMSGFGTGHVWQTLNGGTSWLDVTGTLPDAPVNAIIVDSADPQRLYIASDAGVFRSIDRAASWTRLNAGLPNAPVLDIVLNRAGTQLFAFTFGRGAYAITPVTPTPSPTPIPIILVMVSGRVLTPDGRGLRNATVSMTDSNNFRRTTTTSSFGFYSFDAVQTGQTYIIAVSSRSYRFAPRVFSVAGDLTDIDFVGIE